MYTSRPERLKKNANPTKLRVRRTRGKERGANGKLRIDLIKRRKILSSSTKRKKEPKK